MAEFTPMMRQYFEIKKQCPDYILFYRLGDFYEMFYDDAKTASEVLELTLTGKDCGQEERAPMCGVPYHSSENYVARLVRQGYKVAICEQVEDPKEAKGIVKREIIRMITPGTVIEASMLDENRNNYIAGIYIKGQTVGLCFADVSTGEMYATAFLDKNPTQHVINEVGRFVPSEAVLGCDAVRNRALREFLTERLSCNVEEEAEWAFEEEYGRTRIAEVFDGLDFELEGLNENPAAICAAGGLITYLKDGQMCNLGNMNVLSVYQQGQFMDLDIAARRNLELCETMRAKEKKGSLLWVLDRTRTSMGARLLRQWIEKPLVNPVQIKKRQTAVLELKSNLLCRDELMEALSRVFDMERIISRIISGTANCRDLRSLHSAITNLPSLKEKTQGLAAPLLQEIHQRIDLLADIETIIEAGIVPDPPFSVREGGFIRAGYSREVDELRDITAGGKDKIAEIETKERQKFNVKGLKVGYNRVFGYYIEVPKSYTGSIPPEYVRKQTLTNCERYITDELKAYENTVLGAQDKLTALEYELFCEIRKQIGMQVSRVQKTAQAVSNLDVLCSLAEVGDKNHYTMPEVDFSSRIEIREGRHPVVEQMLRDSLFIPNDTGLDGGENRVAIITGPNMAGKSTYMRQVALITLMAQMGSLVPAKSATIGIADRIFTRVGASDDLSSGKSTFMVEMSEVADILKNATHNSLIILDEIGRGTSTYDGMAIARSVIEYVADTKRIGARTLFATHYHELTALEGQMEGVKNYSIAAKKRGDDIIFLRKIVRGGADDSYGIEVAKLAGVPEKVIRRAKRILADLEQSAPEIPVRAIPEQEEAQVSMRDVESSAVAERLRALDVNTLTPIEALNAIYELQKLI